MSLELTNYWLVLIWIFAGGMILTAFPREHMMICGNVRERWSWVSAIILVLPFTIWAGARSHFGDTRSYISWFNNTPSLLSAMAGIDSSTKDPGFTVLLGAVKSLGIRQPSGFFMLIAVFQMLCLVYTFRKYSSDFWFSMFLFIVSTDYFSWMYNGMRQFIAVAGSFAAFDLLVRKRYVRFTLVVLLLSTIHGSALFMLPFAYIMLGSAMNWKTVLTIAGLVLILPIIDRLLPTLDSMLANTQYNDLMTNEIWASDDGTSIIRVLVYSVPAFMAFFGKRYVQQANDRVVNLCVNATILTMAVYAISMVTSGIYVGRIPIYTTLHGYIVLPWLIDNIFEKASARMMKFVTISFFVAFYYFQMGMTWGLL